MKDEHKNKVPFSVIRERLSRKMNWDVPPNKFDILLFGYCKYRKFSKKYKHDLCKRKYMSKALLLDFQQYIGYNIL